MAAVLPVLQAIGTFAAGVSMLRGPKSPASLPPAPSPEDAEAKAEEEAKKKRLRAMAFGGKTSTTGTPTLVPTSAAAQKTLLGQ